MANTDIPSDLLHWLADVATYPHKPQRVELVETHISIVFLAGERVYKLKRPVKFDFLDFTTVAKREHACREEVRLNRRLAPHVYLGVLAISRSAEGHYQFGAAGEIVDWVVEMRRLPAEKTMETLVRSGQLQPAQVEELARLLGDFYRSLPPIAICPEDYRNRYVAHVQANLRELAAVSHHCPSRLVRLVHGFQLQLLQLRPELFDRRVQAGCIVDGHGDLRPEHVCFAEPVVVFDCIEFNAEFRQIDIADELSFLSAECDYLNATWAGDALFQSVENLRHDRPPPELVAFYKSYRACVRAKVAALRAEQLRGEKRQESIAEANRRLAMAADEARSWNRPLLVLVGGLSGTGKTTLSAALANQLGCELLRTDVVREELFAKSPEPVDYGGGSYDRDSRRQVYRELLRRAMELNREGVSVVLDGTFSMADLVRQANAITTGTQSVFMAIECRVRPEIARARMVQRHSLGRDASEARPEFYEDQRRAWEPWPHGVPQICVDTEASLDAQTSTVYSELRRQIARG